MNRRKVIRNLVLFSLGAGMIYSCKDKYEAIKILDLKYLQPKLDQLDIMDDLSRLIVPLQTIPELKDHTALPFVLNVVENVSTEENRLLFEAGYMTFDAEMLRLKGKPYSEMEMEEKLLLISELNDQSLDANLSLYAMYDTLKAKSIQYLTSCEFYQRKVNYYKMAPGKFHGDVLLANLENGNDE